jgi:hypothetical protein
MPLVDYLNLELAWRRAKLDIAERSFVRIPNEVSLIETDAESWLDSLRESITTNNYHPQAAIVCDIPKAKGAIRPAAHISPADRVIYNACVGACYASIYQSTQWTNDKADFSTPLVFNPNQMEWIRNQFNGWRNFAEESIKKIQEGYPYVVIADISGCYENIDISMLASDLREINVPPEVINQLSTCLNRWAQSTGRGLPQGYGCSDILAKLYLTSFDKHMRALGHTHFRYVDDIRVFCRDKVDARKALIDLIGILRNRGLNIQTAKTGIHPADVALTLIEGVQPIIKLTVNRFIQEIRDVLLTDNPYITMFDAEDALSATPEDTPIEVIREAFRTYFIDYNERGFDKTLFRFLLKRLSKQKDRFAVEYCINSLEAYPEETRAVLSYFKEIGVVEEVTPQIERFLNSREAVYSYQVYLIIEWFLSTGITPSADLTATVRRASLDATQPFYVHSIARYFIGKYGSPTDLEMLERAYPHSSPNEQVEIICALARMERVRRNGFLARAEHDGDNHRRAVRLVRMTT